MTGFKSKKTAALDEEGMYLVHQTDHVEVVLTMVAQPAQEPVVCKHQWFRTGKMAINECRCMNCGAWNTVAPPQRPWVDLTDNQIEQIYYDLVKIHRGAPMPWGQINFGKVLQAAIKDKNK